MGINAQSLSAHGFTTTTTTSTTQHAIPFVSFSVCMCARHLKHFGSIDADVISARSHRSSHLPALYAEKHVYPIDDQNFD